MIHLDTGFLIQGLVRGTTEDQCIRRWLRAGEELGMCTVAWTEFLCGPLDDAQVRLATRVIGERPAFTEADAKLAADLFNRSGRRRGSLMDCMIGATAIGAGVPLATTNIKDFERFVEHGLQLERD